MSHYRLAVRAYPTSYREQTGSEIVALANELTDGRWSLRQSVGLLTGGLRTRARLATGSSPRAVWESAARSALLVWIVMGAGLPLAAVLGLPWAPSFAESRMVLILPTLLVVALTMSTRWWVALLIAAYGGQSVWRLSGEWPSYLGFPVEVVSSAAVMVAVAWWLALATDGRRVAGPSATGVLLVLVSLWSGALAAGGVYALGAILILAGIALGSLVVAGSDPRLAAAVSVLALFFAAWTLPLAVGNDQLGLNYWGPIVLTVAFVALPLSAAWLGSRRMVRA